MRNIVIYRSWNMAKERFIYFVNGYYCDPKNAKKRIQICNSNFNWNNAEMFIGFHDDNHIKIFENDFVNFVFRGFICELYTTTVDSRKVVFKDGSVKFIQLNDRPKIKFDPNNCTNILVVGNTHETRIC